MLLIAHRGDALNYRENSIDAFQSAFDYGADGIELDIHYFNNELIVVHDYLFDKKIKYPTLQEVIDKFGTRGRIEIELKAWDISIFEPLKEVLRNSTKLNIELTTSEVPVGCHIKEHFPKYKFGLIMQQPLFPDWMDFTVVSEKIIGWAKTSSADIVHLPFNVLDIYGKRLVEKLHRNNVIVHSHIKEDQEQIARLNKLIEWNVDQCTFEDISMIRKRWLEKNY